MKKMRTIFYTIGIAACAAAVGGCQPQAPETWMSATTAYDGKWQFSTSVVEYGGEVASIKDNILDGMYLEVYNTAANTPNEIWVRAVRILPSDYGVYPMLAKLNITGSPEAFSAPITPNTNNGNHYYVVTADDDWLLPTSADARSLITQAGETIGGAWEYTKVTLEEGKILTGAATTLGGNKADSIYLKFKLQVDEITWESYAPNPAAPTTYAWRIVPGSNTYAYDETWILSGWRYTGFPEDVHPE